ncbi:kinase-like domain-containing protein [Halteromyces radiatus]|uniref:kinase-like domain-containing protein n=1 Tax=Halteromyces radiatus TaxID=101107 RepID=UPI00221F0A5E|nr:kinase-like domain-containing protein [Halteromyces radiatus]KAI8093652.1 kinase-like domain-containing protein [Halteromyces radiatus]
MANDLLLRLFNSEFFNAWIAVSYLFKYSDNIGIQNYLCESLKKFPSVEIEFFLPQLMHLLVTQPSVSVALEDTLIDLGKQSPHFAVMSIWYLQAYMSDWSSDPTSLSYQLCERVLNKCQATLMNDQLPIEWIETSKQIQYQDDDNEIDITTTTQQLHTTNIMTESSKRITLTQEQQESRVKLSQDFKSMDNDHDENPSPLHSSSRSLRSADVIDAPKIPLLSPRSTRPFSFSVSLEDLHGGKAFSLSRYLASHMKWPPHKPFHPSHFQQQPTMSDQQSRHLENSLPSSPCFSPRTSFESNSIHDRKKNLNQHRCHKQRHQVWARSGYFQYQMQFLVALSDIAERLVSLPKHARVSALHAELTLLNHNLPAEICLPLWCSGSCSSLHHRVVRVSPSDAVVLNSAERAPYLLMIEVLEEGLCLEAEGKETKSREMDVSLVAYDTNVFTLDKANDIEIDFGEEEEDDTLDLGTLGDKKHMSMTTTPLMATTTTDQSLDDPFTSAETNPPSSDFSRQMRTAAVMLAQLQQKDDDPNLAMVQAIRQRVIDQMVSLEEQRLGTATLDQVAQPLGNDTKVMNDNDGQKTMAMIMNKDDPSAAVFSEAWHDKKERIRNSSPYGHLPNWRLLSVIVKQGTDLRQEQFAIQLIREMQKIWQDAGVDAWVQYYRVLVTSDNSGLIETIRNTISIHSIKKNANTHPNAYTLYDFFEQRWGPSTSSTFRAAQDAFMKSLVGYSIACYLLQIKDRHNGNLLLDDQGHLIHIDFGFVLSNSPGSVGFEMAPFKLSQEYVDVLGGTESELFNKYRILMKQAFKAVRKYGDNILLLVEMMSKDSSLPCFQYGADHVLSQLKERFQFHLTEPQLEAFVDKLIVNSYGNLFTRLYDTFQYYSQGIL